MESSSLCFPISGGLNIVFGLNTGMIRPQILWAEKATQQTLWRDSCFQVGHKNRAFAAPAGVPGSSWHVSPLSSVGHLYRASVLAFEGEIIGGEEVRWLKATTNW